MVPRSSIVCCTAAPASASLVTSAAANAALAPSSSASLAPSACGRSTIIALPPPARRSPTGAAPSPEAPPVTSATVPSTFIGPPNQGHKGPQRHQGHLDVLAVLLVVFSEIRSEERRVGK